MPTAYNTHRHGFRVTSMYVCACVHHAHVPKCSKAIYNALLIVQSTLVGTLNTCSRTY